MLGTMRSRERASHHGIGRNLKRTAEAVNGDVLLLGETTYTGLAWEVTEVT